MSENRRSEVLSNPADLWCDCPDPRSTRAASSRTSFHSALALAPSAPLDMTRKRSGEAELTEHSTPTDQRVVSTGGPLRPEAERPPRHRHPRTNPTPPNGPSIPKRSQRARGGVSTPLRSARHDQGGAEEAASSENTSSQPEPRRRRPAKTAVCRLPSSKLPPDSPPLAPLRRGLCGSTCYILQQTSPSDERRTTETRHCPGTRSSPSGEAAGGAGRR